MAPRRIRGNWTADFRYGVKPNRKRYRMPSPIDTKAGAVEYETILRMRLARGEPIEGTPEACQPASVTFASFAERWLATEVATNDKPSTAHDKALVLHAHLLPAFGDKDLSRISTPDVEYLKANLHRRKRSPKTINNILCVLGTCLRAACEAKLLTSLPRLKHLEVTLPPFDFLTFDEADYLLASPIPEPWHTTVLCALRTGMRRGELRGLQWSDVNLNTRIITVCHSLVEGVLGSPKSHKIRHIPIADDLLAALRALGPGHGFVFTRNGKPLYENLMFLALRRICKQANVRPIGWHVFRHTFASHLVMRGVPIRHVQVLMGHSSVEMTERYAHLAPSDLETAVSTLTAVSPNATDQVWALMGTRAVSNPREVIVEPAR